MSGDDGFGRRSDEYGSPYGGVEPAADERSSGAGRTRTRLPDAVGPPAGRRTASPRSLTAVLGIVVLLIAAIAFANRGGGDGGGSEGKSKGGTSADPTAPSGERPAEGRNGDIPAGFAKTEQGAQSAAANFAVVLGGDDMYRAEGRRQIVDAVYAPEVVEKTRADLDKVYSDEDFLGKIGLKANGEPPSGSAFISRVSPVGTKAEEFGGDSASVSVWYSSLFGLTGEGATNPVSEGWYTNTFEMTWVDGDWKITDFTQKDGPTPVGRDQRASSAEEMAEAVEGFGGFTYAR